jgi:transketolase
MDNEIRDVFFQELLAHFKSNDQSVLLTVDMGARALKDFRRQFSDRFFNVGVAEQNAVSVASGLSASNKTPFIYGITPFLLSRARAQLRHDVAIGNRSICVVGSGVGLTYAEDGPSHHSLDDIALLAGLPNLATYTPVVADNVKEVLSLYVNGAGLSHTSFVRLDKCLTLDSTNKNFSINRDHGTVTFYSEERNTIKGKSQNCILTATPTLALELLKNIQESDIVFLYRVDNKTSSSLREVLNDYHAIELADESYLEGGIGMKLAVAFAMQSKRLKFSTMENRIVQEKWGRSALREKYSSFIPK